MSDYGNLPSLGLHQVRTVLDPKRNLAAIVADRSDLEADDERPGARVSRDADGTLDEFFATDVRSVAGWSSDWDNACDDIADQIRDQSITERKAE